MNILFIHEVDWLKRVVYEIHTLSELLSLRGHNIYVVDYESMWTKDNMFGFGSLKTKELNVARAYPRASVKLFRPGFIKIPVVSRISAFLTHYWAIKRIIKERKINVIILYSVPTNGLQAIALAKQFGIPVIFRSIDTVNQLVHNKLLSKITYVLEKVVYSNVDLILTISPKLSDYVKGMGAPNVRMLLLGVDTRLFYPEIKSVEISKQWNLNGKDQVIMFVGTLPEFSGLDLFIYKFPQILKEAPNAKLVIVGGGAQHTKLQHIVTELNLQDKIIITGFQPNDVVPQYINLAEVCISTFPISNVTKDIFPTKIIQYLACGKSVVSTSLPGLTTIIEGEKQGVVYASDWDEMANKITALLKSEEARQKLSQAAVSYIEQNHSYDNIICQLECELDKLVRSKRESNASKSKA